jgi:hypothetical protein
MDKVTMLTEKAKILLNQTIEACLLDCPLEQRLSYLTICLSKLEDYEEEAPEELVELRQIASILACNRENFSPDRDFEVTDRLLTLYIGASAGALIF